MAGESTFNIHHWKNNMMKKFEKVVQQQCLVGLHDSGLGGDSPSGLGSSL